MPKNLHVANFRIRHISEGGSAFAVDMTSGEQVFIGKHLIEDFDVKVGDLLRCACEENYKSDESHWYALVVEPIWEE